MRSLGQTPGWAKYAWLLQHVNRVSCVTSHQLELQGRRQHSDKWAPWARSRIRWWVGGPNLALTVGEYAPAQEHTSAVCSVAVKAEP